MFCINLLKEAGWVTFKCSVSEGFKLLVYPLLQKAGANICSTFDILQSITTH